MDPSTTQAKGGADDSGVPDTTVGGERNDTEHKPKEDVEDDEDDLIGEPDTGFGEGGESYSDEWRTARDEATSLEHLMDHYPKNRFCRACQWGNTIAAVSTVERSGPTSERIW